MGGFKHRLHEGFKAIGMMLTIFDQPDIVRILHVSGFDYFFFDGEHGYIDPDRLNPMFAYARFLGITGFLRIPEINKTEILRAVDMGVDGIYAPMVESAEEAAELVRHAKYHPEGNRGVNFMRPHTGYRKVSAADYTRRANDELFLVCMIETMRGVRNVDAILSVPGVDAIMIGHNDLTQDMGILGQIRHPEFLAAVDTVAAGCKAHNKFLGMSVDDMEQMAANMHKGVSLNQWSSDVAVFAKHTAENIARVRELENRSAT